MDLDQFDIRLGELRAASEIVTANLFELDAHNVRHMLDAATLTGVSASRWQAATRDLADLWRLLPILSTFVRRVGDRRGTKRSLSDSSLAELCRLVEEPAVEFGVTAVPLEERGVLDRSEVTTWCTVDELLARIAASFERVNSAIADASRAWDQYAPRVRAVQASLAATDSLLTELGGDTHELTEQRDLVHVLATRLIEDPMSVDEVAIADAEARAAGAQLDGVAASQLKAGFDDAYGEATSLLTQLEDLAHAIDEAHEEVCAKILDPEVPPPKPADSSALREELAHVVVETSTGRWVAAQGLLAQWSDHARAEVLESRRTLDAIRAPLEQRKQMRGLLDAYHAKGVATGMLEDENAGQLYDRTRAALYTAPTDLDGAAGLLRLFGRSVSGSDVLEGVE